jgi:hypothetical protein
LRRDIVNLSSQVARRAHGEISGLTRLACKTVASLILREKNCCGAANDCADKKTGEESAASAITLAHN